jgi:transcriptional regulator with XRE-family HTH domain
MTNDTVETLKDLRLKRGMAQTELAARIGVKASSVAQVEGRQDLHVSMLRSVIEGLGGRMEISAVFPDVRIEVVGFSKINSLVEELQGLVNHRCFLHPMPTERSKDEFFVRDVNDSIVMLDKLSNHQRIEIPVRRIVEILPGTDHPSLPPTIVLRGSMKWSALRKVWDYTP